MPIDGRLPTASLLAGAGVLLLDRPGRSLVNAVLGVAVGAAAPSGPDVAVGVSV